jgi:hypothetical protein
VIPWQWAIFIAKLGFSFLERNDFMLTLQVKLDTIDMVKGFSELMSGYDGACDLVSERYVIDAKSIMGVFSLDLAKPLELRLSNGASPELLEALKPYQAA